MNMAEEFPRGMKDEAQMRADTMALVRSAMDKVPRLTQLPRKIVDDAISEAIAAYGIGQEITLDDLKYVAFLAFENAYNTVQSQLSQKKSVSEEFRKALFD